LSPSTASFACEGLVPGKKLAGRSVNDDQVATGCELKVQPTVQADGRIRLHLVIQYATILERTRDHTLSQVNQARYCCTLDPGQTTKVRLTPETSGKVLWAEIKALVIVPQTRSQADK
jgi:hypothetical protein